MGTTPRTVLIVALLMAWVLMPSLAIASGACMTMGGMCEGPCGAASCAVVICVSGLVLPAVSDAITPAPDQFSSVPLRLPELPPRSHLLLA
jgi:hypothetical protein